jgi:hypothetical protein
MSVLRGHYWPDQTPGGNQRLRRLALGTNIVTIALSLDYLLSRVSSQLVLAALIVLPWVAVSLVAHFQPFYCFGGERNERRPDLLPTLVAPGFVIWASHALMLHPVNWYLTLVPTSVGALALSGAAAWADPRLRKQKWGVLLVMLLTGTYGYGVGMELNALADHSPAEIYPVVVTAKHVNYSSKGTSSHLTLQPWGPVTHSSDEFVSPDLYQSTPVGGIVCVSVRSGALRIAWYTIISCGNTR